MGRLATWGPLSTWAAGLGNSRGHLTCLPAETGAQVASRPQPGGLLGRGHVWEAPQRVTKTWQDMIFSAS